MEDETTALVDAIERVGQATNGDIVVKQRLLKNWQRSNEDCDLELGIGPHAQLDQVLQVIEEHENWTVRWLTTGDPPDVTSSRAHVNIALIYHPPNPDPEGTIWFDAV